MILSLVNRLFFNANNIPNTKCYSQDSPFSNCIENFVKICAKKQFYLMSVWHTNLIKGFDMKLINLVKLDFILNLKTNSSHKSTLDKKIIDVLSLFTFGWSTFTLFFSYLWPTLFSHINFSRRTNSQLINLEQLFTQLLK